MEYQYNQQYIDLLKKVFRESCFLSPLLSSLFNHSPRLAVYGG